jgi:hypothetical protein
MTLRIPTVHINGTSKESLMDQLRNAHTAISDAMDVLAKAAPHARDYYVQQDETATNEATAQHRARLVKLQEVQAELYKMWEGVDAQ